MTLAVYLVAAAALAVFLAACTWRVLLFARSPIHLRWELYPVPHESPGRVAHGGSYFEQSEWWKQPRPAHLVSELRFMVPEILFLRALRTHNRALWYRSFPFHFGLYALAGASLLLFGLVAAAGLPTGPVSDWLADVSWLVGAIGAVSCVAGAAGLLHRRMTDPALRSSTTPGDVFNLWFFIAALLLLVAGYAVRPPGAPSARAILAGLLSWNLAVPIPWTLGLGLIATALLVAYIPLTHMSHFIAKYFMYHAVRWDDAALAHNAARARAMADYLTWRPTWSAPHVGADGSRTWSEVVADGPAGASLPQKPAKESK